MDNNNGHEIVERIDEILKTKNLKRQAVADHIGISTQSFTHWSKRRNIPSADIIFKMAEFLGVSAKYLVTGKTESGIPQDVLNLAYDVMAFDKSDIDEITAIIELKKRKYVKQDAT